MSTSTRTARAVGVLFIVASATAIIGGLLIQPINQSDYLTEAASAEGAVVTGVLFELLLAATVISIAVLLFPVLKRHNEALALGYVAARIVEAVFILAASTSALLVLTLSQDYGQSPPAGVEPLGEVLIAARDRTYLIGTMVAFSVSALILYTLLYRSKLVPTWLSLWGLVGGALLLLEAIFQMFGVELAVALQAILTAPIALNEMVLAVWLIVKGFSGIGNASVPEGVAAST